MSDMALLRIGILAAGLLLVVAIFLFGRPKKLAQGKRREQADTEPPRREPVLGAAQAGDEAEGRTDAEVSQPELGLPEVEPAPGSELGKRANQDFDKIVSLYVAARAGQVLRGEDIVVAAEKTGLVFGYMSVFHRLVEGHPERGPIFSMASIMKPGSFDMAHIREMETPAIAFFLTLPAPLSALEAWRKCCPPCSAWANCSTAWCWTTAATHWAASASPTSATTCVPTTANTRHRR